MEEEGIELMGRLYLEQVDRKESKVREEKEEEDSAYPSEVLDMLARLYNASRENDEPSKENGEVVRTSKNLEVKKEEGNLEDDEEAEGLEDLLGQMYNTSQGMARGLLRVVEEGRMERKKEGELFLRCFQEEQRVYQVNYIFKTTCSLFVFVNIRCNLEFQSKWHQVALVAIAHIAVWPQAQAFLEEKKPNCVHCLYR